MTKTSINKVIIMAITTIFAGLLAACGLKDVDASDGDGAKNKVTYKYENSKVRDEVEITKSVYSDGKLVIYISNLSDNLSMVYYDSDFNTLETDFDYDYTKGRLTIKGDGAEKISGIRIKGGPYDEIKLRYLDSEQYAILVDYFVDDLGTETYGDRNAYYTEEERAAQQAAKDEHERQQTENYMAVEGYWESVANDGQYIYIFTDENGKRWLRQAYIYNDELVIDDTFICTINISEIGISDYYAYYHLEILDSDGWGCCYQFDLNEDMTAIMDWNTKQPGFVKKEGVTLME